MSLEKGYSKDGSDNGYVVNGNPTGVIKVTGMGGTCPPNPLESGEPYNRGAANRWKPKKGIK